MPELQTAVIEEGTAPQEEAQTLQTEQVNPEGQESTHTDEKKAHQEKVQAQADEAGITYSAQKQINKHVAKGWEKDQKIKEAHQEIERLRAEAPAPIQTGEPKPEDFDFDDAKYQSAMVDYKVDQKFNTFQQEQVQQQAQVAQQAVASTYNQRVVEFENQTPDFQEKISQLPLGNQAVVDAIMLADNGPAIAYHLANHLDVADSLQNASPTQAAMMIGQLSATVSATVPTNLITDAPPPIDTLNSGGGVHKQDDGPENATYE